MAGSGCSATAFQIDLADVIVESRAGTTEVELSLQCGFGQVSLQILPKAAHPRSPCFPHPRASKTPRTISGDSAWIALRRVVPTPSYLSVDETVLAPEFVEGCRGAEASL